MGRRQFGKERLASFDQGREGKKNLRKQKKTEERICVGNKKNATIIPRRSGMLPKGAISGIMGQGNS